MASNTPGNRPGEGIETNHSTQHLDVFATRLQGAAERYISKEHDDRLAYINKRIGRLQEDRKAKHQAPLSEADEARIRADYMLGPQMEVERSGLFAYYNVPGGKENDVINAQLAAHAKLDFAKRNGSLSREQANFLQEACRSFDGRIQDWFYAYATTQPPEPTLTERFIRAAKNEAHPTKESIQAAEVKRLNQSLSQGELGKSIQNLYTSAKAIYGLYEDYINATDTNESALLRAHALVLARAWQNAYQALAAGQHARFREFMEQLDVKNLTGVRAMRMRARTEKDVRNILG